MYDDTSLLSHPTRRQTPYPLIARIKQTNPQPPANPLKSPPSSYFKLRCSSPSNPFKPTTRTHLLPSALSWLALVITATFSTYQDIDHETKGLHRIFRGFLFFEADFHTNYFLLNSSIACVYWIVLWRQQLSYMWDVYKRDEVAVAAAQKLGLYFVATNLVWVASVLLWTHGCYLICLGVLASNFVGLTIAYRRCSKLPLGVHVPLLSGPLAFNFVALFMVGSANSGEGCPVVEMFATVFVWSFLVYGVVYLGVYKDYTMGFALSVLMAGKSSFSHFHSFFAAKKEKGFQLRFA